MTATSVARRRVLRHASGMPPFRMSPEAQRRNLTAVGYVSYAILGVLLLGFCVGVIYAFARTAYRFFF